jgi:hypothetical protein
MSEVDDALVLLTVSHLTRFDSISARCAPFSSADDLPLLLVTSCAPPRHRTLRRPFDRSNHVRSTGRSRDDDLPLAIGSTRPIAPRGRGQYCRCTGVRGWCGLCIYTLDMKGARMHAATCRPVHWSLAHDVDVERRCVCATKAIRRLSGGGARRVCGSERDLAHPTTTE